MLLSVALSPAVLSIGGIVVVGVIAAAVLGVGTFAVARVVKARRAAKASGVKVAPKSLPGLPGLLGNLGSIDLNRLLQSPLIQELLKAALPAAHAAQQQAVNLLVARLFPPLTPFLPGIDKGVADLDALIEAKFGIGQTSPSEPAGPSSVVIPAGHPILDLLQKTLEARQAQREQSGK